MMSLAAIEVDAFGNRCDWSTWTGVEIGSRIVYYLNSKINSDFGGSSSPLSSNSKLSAHPSRNRSSEHSPRKIVETSTDLNVVHSGRHFDIEPVRAVPSDFMAVFTSDSEPPISLLDYVNRLIYYTRISISPVNLAVALFYIERIERSGLCSVNKYTIFRLFAVSYLIAYKYMDDPPVMKNAEFSKIAGVSLHELNHLETNFLVAINFELGVGDDLSIAQKITRILVPPKVSPGILIGLSSRFSSKILSDVNRSTPDSVVADVEQSEYVRAFDDDNYGYFVEGDHDDDVFDRQSVYDNYSNIACVRAESNGGEAEDNFESNFHVIPDYQYHLRRSFDEHTDDCVGNEREKGSGSDYAEFFS